MLIVRPIGPQAVAYYFPGRTPGHWAGEGCRTLGLDPEAEVTARQLRCILEGRHPGTGASLPPRRPARRRPGWDLTLAAPKSVSLLAALLPSDAGLIAGAHRAAVGEVLDQFERRMLWVRRRFHERTVLVPGCGLVSAAFDHLHNAAGEPHLHTHLLMANLGQATDGRWSAVANEGWWPERRALTAIYQLGLRHHLAAAGLRLSWRLRADGLGDVEAVPRSAIEAASGRTRAVLAERARVQPTGPSSAQGRAAATYRSRSAQEEPSWVARVTASGFDAAAALRAVETGRQRPRPVALLAPGEPKLARPVSAWLSERASTFVLADVLLALAANAGGGAPAENADAWAAAFCRASLPAPGMRWTTPGARWYDERLVDAGSRQTGTAAIVAGVVVDSVIAARPGLNPVTERAVRQLLGFGAPVDILGAPPGASHLIASAAVLDTARTGWQEAGYRVSVATPDPAGASRWHALTGLGPAPPEGSADPFDHADVVIVDQAERRPSGPLLRLVEQAHRHGAKLVLVEGGTRPRLSRPRSLGLGQLGERIGRIDAGPATGPATGWDGPPGPAVRLEELKLIVCASGSEAARHLVAAWAAGHGGQPSPVLVGLGPPEVAALNEAARLWLGRNGRLAGPAVVAAGRPIQAGDRLLAMRRTTLDGQTVPPGTHFDVAAVNASARSICLQRGDRTTLIDARAAVDLGYAYAITPALAQVVDGTLLVLGELRDLGFSPGRASLTAVVAPALARPRSAPSHLAALASLAADRPSTRLPLHVSLPALQDRRDRLARELAATLPADPSPERRRYEEDLAWATKAPGAKEALDLQRRAAQLLGSERALAQWRQAHAPDLLNLRQLDDALAVRAAAMGHAATGMAVDGPRRHRDGGLASHLQDIDRGLALG